MDLAELREREKKAKDTIAQYLEPMPHDLRADVHMSIAISLKRIADALSTPKDFRAGWKAAEGELCKTGSGPPKPDDDEDLRWVALLLSTRRPWRE